MTLAWDKFAALEGGPERNLELLCRSIVAKQYEQFGTLRSVRQQPGIEFHLKLHVDCDLGKAGRWFGWQCRWLELTTKNEFRANQREKIKEAIEKAKKHVPGLTDFVLCLREMPAKKDEDWYHALPSHGMQLHLWADEAIEARLAGDAAILRRSYFGELIFSAADLCNANARSVGPVKDRWLPELNVATRIERRLRAALMQPGSAERLGVQAGHLSQLSADVTASLAQIESAEIAAQVERLAEELSRAAGVLAGIQDATNSGDPDGCRILTEDGYIPEFSLREVRMLARRVRALGVPVALLITTIEGHIVFTRRLLGAYQEVQTAEIIAVVGNPGRGKSHLAMQLTARPEHEVRGVFLRGSTLSPGQSVNEVVRDLPGLAVNSVDELLEGMEATGARNGRRIPLVIDGLNEAQRPPDWHDQLAQLLPVLSRYPHVLLVVTLRPIRSEEILISEAMQLELRWSRNEVWRAVRLYFDHYRIDSGALKLPIYLFQDPLFLRFFCEAVNGSRKNDVGMGSIPGDLVAVYELYRDGLVARLAKKLDKRSEYIAKQLRTVALELWTRKSRDLPFEDVQKIINEPEDRWQDSLARMLEDEGVLLRHGETGWTDQRSAILFDRFAGYLIADALVFPLSMDTKDDFLSDAQLWEQLLGGGAARHPLAMDIFVALVGLVPRRFHHVQLVDFAPTDHCEETLTESVQLESGLISEATVEALAELVGQIAPPRFDEEHLFDRLWELRAAEDHRLNAEFLDRALRSLAVATRDLGWTEWVRSRREVLTEDLEHAIERWAADDRRNRTDELEALAIAWLLPVTNVRLRDLATEALCAFGSPDPRKIFEVAARLIDVNDPYVVERVVGATLGAASRHQLPDPGGSFQSALRSYLAQLGDVFLEPGASAPTDHQVIRGYVRDLFEFAEKLHGAAVPESVQSALDLQFAAGADVSPLSRGSDEGNEVSATLGMDFKNYTVGPLYESRGNYQDDHPDYQSGLAEIRGRVWDLGWREATFAEVDKRIRDDERRPRPGKPGAIERYGKKYALIAYCELAGRLSPSIDTRDHWTGGRLVWPDLDPTFPIKPPRIALSLPRWASVGSDDDERWIRDSVVEVPEEVFWADEIDGEAGPWILVEGNLSHTDEILAREVWGHFRSVLVENEAVERLLDDFHTRQYLGNHHIPEAPDDHASFAGEIPWSARFHEWGDGENGLPPYHRSIRLAEEEITVEILAHRYGFSAERSEQPSGMVVPSASFCDARSLRKVGTSFDLVGLDGATVGKATRAPEGFKGRMLYLRLSDVADYAKGRSLIQVGWGERQINVGGWNRPKWLQAVYAVHDELWREIRHRDLRSPRD